MVNEWKKELNYKGTGRGFKPCLCQNSLFIIIQRILTNGLTKTTNTLSGIESKELWAYL